MLSQSRALSLLKHKCTPFLSPLPPSAFPLTTHIHMDQHSSKNTTNNNGYFTCLSKPRSTSLPPAKRGPVDGTITLQEWQGWGTTSPVPASVVDAIAYLKSLEAESDALMSFGGNGGRLVGEFKVEEDKKHRAAYHALSESDKKFQFFSARQIACRLLGSRGYLCQKCWLALEDCMCSKVKPCPLWRGVRFWVYMHPKDFLRQNNTGKLLWQVFGVHAATLCLFGIVEHEDIMWNEFRKAGKTKVWCLYPSKGGDPKSIKDYFPHGASLAEDCASRMTSRDDILNFILIDGTWNNSAAMFKRLKDRAEAVWGEDDIACVSLATGASAMHKLRPQPSWDRTCTAAAAAGLLSELQLLPQFVPFCLDKQGEVLEDALEALLEALTTRRLRMGRSITRKVRANNCIC